MPLTPDQIDALPTYTSAQQLKMWQRASIQVAGEGVSNEINGRRLTRANAGEIENMICYWSEKVAMEEAGAQGGGNVIVRLAGP